MFIVASKHRDTEWNYPSCHGPAIFANLLDSEIGIPIVQGKKITGFTTQAEYDMKIMDGLLSWGEPMIDEHAKAQGAECKLHHPIAVRHPGVH